VSNAERATWLAVAEVVEQWEPGVATASVDDSAAVAIAHHVDGVLVVECLALDDPLDDAMATLD
jgi:hypothetical protein